MKEIGRMIIDMGKVLKYSRMARIIVATMSMVSWTVSFYINQRRWII